METYSADLSDLGPTPTVPEEVQPPPATVASKMSLEHRLAMVVVGFGLVGVTWVAAVKLIRDPGFDPNAPLGSPVEGLTIFAVFFVVAAGLERLLEPLATAFGAKPKDAASQAVAAATTAVNEATGPDALGDPTAALATGLEKVAKAKAEVGVWVEWTKVLTWAVASCLGILAASALKLYLLRRVGIAAPPRALEILATGLIIGAGTKPLHDLTKLIEKKKEGATAAAAGTPS